MCKSFTNISENVPQKVTVVSAEFCDVQHADVLWLDHLTVAIFEANACTSPY